MKIDVNLEGLNNPKMGMSFHLSLLPLLASIERFAGARGLSQSQPSQDDDEPDEPRDPTRMYGVLVSIKSFLKFLNSHVVSTTTIACKFTHLIFFFIYASMIEYRLMPSPYSGLCQNPCLILYVYIGEISDTGGVLTFYVPAIIDDGP